jgi:PAS domain S-box-containing protein
MEVLEGLCWIVLLKLWIDGHFPQRLLASLLGLEGKGSSWRGHECTGITSRSGPETLENVLNSQLRRRRLLQVIDTIPAMAHSHEHDTTAGTRKMLAGSQDDRAALEALINLMPTIAWRARPDGSTEFINKRFYEYTGLSAEEASGWGWRVVIHPDELPQVMNYYREVLSSGEPGEMEVRMRRFDGEYRWFLVRAAPHRD